MAVPISYQASSEFAIHFGPKVYYYSYKVSSSISSSGGPDPFSESRSLRRSYFSPGISLGVRFDTISPEVTVVLVENKLVPYLGVAFRPSFLISSIDWTQLATAIHAVANPLSLQID